MCKYASNNEFLNLLASDIIDKNSFGKITPQATVNERYLFKLNYVDELRGHKTQIAPIFCLFYKVLFVTAIAIIATLYHGTIIRINNMV